MTHESFRGLVNGQELVGQQEMKIRTERGGGWKGADSLQIANGGNFVHNFDKKIGANPNKPGFDVILADMLRHSTAAAWTYRATPMMGSESHPIILSF
jgi:hypothetical protein